MDRFHVMEHTADIGLQVWSSTVNGIYTKAAQGLFSIITDVQKIESTVTRTVSLEAESYDELLVVWLNHLNFLFETEGELYSKFDPLSIENHHLEAVVAGEPFSEEKHEIFREIKAVTYHQLKFEHRKDGWFAQVIFDI